MPALPLTGSCQCGGVKYEVTQPPLTVSNCHCTNCQRITTSAFAISVMVPAAAFQVTQGVPGRVEWTAASGNRRYGLFCTGCGCRIIHGSEPERDIIIVRAGTLDDTSWIRPVSDIWTESAVPWLRFAGERLEYPGQPDDMQPLIEAFARQKVF